MTTSQQDNSGDVRERQRFLSRLEPFKGLPKEELEHVAQALVETTVAAGDAVLVEGGEPGSELFVVRDGTLELVNREVVVAIIGSGDVFGHPTLLTGLAPEFTTRARTKSHLYCIPRDIAMDILSRTDGVRFVARPCATACSRWRAP